jgi:cyclophilin family peptidyl-prolyl cis-trans isomerase
MNFLQYAADGFYSGTIFHRVRDHLIQGGAYTPNMELKSEGLRAPVRNESIRGLDNLRGTIALYRDPQRPHSARAQFFINVKDNSSLDRLRDGYGYTVFGKVVEGMDVVDKIAASEVEPRPQYAAGRLPVVPKTPVVIQSMTPLGTIDRAKAFERAADLEDRAKNPLKYAIADLETKHGAQARKSESGLIWVDIKEGSGAFPLEDDTVEFIFQAWVLGSVKPFDSSAQRSDKPAKVRLNNLLDGLKEGLAGMREGGKRAVIIPPALGFGEAGMPGKVPPDATLIYDIELIGVSRDEPDE